MSDNSAPAWALGYKLEELRYLAGIFKQAHKDYVYGAFGMVKERDVASALAFKTFYVYGKERQGAAIICSKLKSTGWHHDFAGWRYGIQAGSFYVSSLAVNDSEDGKGIIRALLEGGDPVWIEIFEEDRTARMLMDHFKFDYIFTKVTAAGEIKGMYYSHGSKNSGTLFDTVPYSRVPEEEAWCLKSIGPNFVSVYERRIITDLLSEDPDVWAQHYSNYNKRGTWTSFALRGYDINDPEFIIYPGEMSKKWQADNPDRANAQVGWTKAMTRFEFVGPILKRLPVETDDLLRVRFMRLARTNGELTRHADTTDKFAGIADGKNVRLHVPIITNDNVMFSSWDHRGVRHDKMFAAGEIFYLDTRKPHAVVNLGRSDRVHLVIDAISSPELRQWIKEGYHGD